MTGTATPKIQEQPMLMIVLGRYAIIACGVFVVAILIADIVVPDHDWIADTISDLGAGRYEFIVDIGIYTYSGALLSLAVLSAHVHLGGWRWSVGTVGLVILGLLVFLIGARNEYGDNDNEGVVIHVYLVYVLGLLVAVIPWLMSQGAYRAGARYGRLLRSVSIVWIISAPVFFMLPTDVDGIYERYLGLVSFGLVIGLGQLFVARGKASSNA